MNNLELDLYFEILKCTLLKSSVKINKWREKFILDFIDGAFDMCFQVISRFRDDLLYLTKEKSTGAKVVSEYTMGEKK